MNLRDDIVLINVDDKNLDDYLAVKREAASVSSLYQISEELWELSKNEFRKEYESGNTISCLIYNQISDVNCGYISLEGCNESDPYVDIAILDKFKHQYIGYTAAQKFVAHIFSQYDYKYLNWENMVDNVASAKIAKMIGGKICNEIGPVYKKVQMLEGVEDMGITLKTEHFIINRPC